MNKTAMKILFGLTIATAATAIVAVGILRELKAIKNIEIHTDELPEDPDENADEAAE